MKLKCTHYLGLGLLLCLTILYFSTTWVSVIEGNTNKDSDKDSDKIKATTKALKGLKKMYTKGIKKELLSYSTETALATGMPKIQQAMGLSDTIDKSLKLLGSSGSDSSSSSSSSSSGGGGGHLSFL